MPANIRVFRWFSAWWAVDAMLSYPR